MYGCKLIGGWGLRLLVIAAKGTVLVLSKTTLKADLALSEEWNRIANRLKRLDALFEAQQIEERNNVKQSWVSSAEMRARLAKRGVDAGSVVSYE